MLPNMQRQIDALVAKYLTDPKPKRDERASESPEFGDEEIIALCRAAKNAQKFATLFDDGDVHAYHNGDDSVADLALMVMLAFYTQDADQLERLFSESALGQREKWQRQDYRKRTIDKALGALTETYTPPKKPEPMLWPEMDDAAYRGIFGRLVELADEHTEADPVALLVSAIAAFGNAAGRNCYMQVGATKHHPNLFAALVGATAKGRKGESWGPVENVMHATDEAWTIGRIQSGLSSGEGLIYEVRDPIRVPDKDGDMRITDPGVDDKRLLVMEGELSQALKVMKREGNILSPLMRNAWDGRNLKTMTKHSPLKATEPHVSVLGHITSSELVKHLTEVEMANGLANRFLWVLVKRSKSLPFGGAWHTVDLVPVTRKLFFALSFASKQEYRMDWSEDAKDLWRGAYEALTEDRPGMFGAITARAEAQALRLSMIYALADMSYTIKRTHVESALAVWQYAEESARYVFGDTIGDEDADKVLSALKDGAMTRTEISELFGHNKSTADIERVKKLLVDAGKIRVEKRRTEGSKRPVEWWHRA